MKKYVIDLKVVSVEQIQGKDVLLKILNSPRADYSKLQKIASAYEKKALEMMKLENSTSRSV